MTDHNLFLEDLQHLKQYEVVLSFLAQLEQGEVLLFRSFLGQVHLLEASIPWEYLYLRNIEAYGLGLIRGQYDARTSPASLRMIIACASDFVNAYLARAMVYAEDETLQHLNPSYCLALSILIRERVPKPDPVNVARWNSTAAYCLALIRDFGALATQAYLFVEGDRERAEQHACNEDMQRKNPLYVHAICQALFKRAENKDKAGYWENIGLYCLSLTKDKLALSQAAKYFIQRFSKMAEEYANNSELQQKNPLYCAALFQQMAEAEHPMNRDKKLQFLWRASQCFLLACDIPEFVSGITAWWRLEHGEATDSINIWPVLMDFLANHYTHPSNVLILDFLVSSALSNMNTLVYWARPFKRASDSFTYNGLSLLMYTLYEHWEEIGVAARCHMAVALTSLSRMFPPDAWTIGMTSAEGQLMNTPLRLMRLLFDKAPTEVFYLLDHTIQNAPALAWHQKVAEDPRPVYRLFDDLEGPLKQRFEQRRLLPHAAEGALLAHSFLREGLSCPLPIDDETSLQQRPSLGTVPIIF